MPDGKTPDDSEGVILGARLSVSEARGRLPDEGTKEDTGVREMEPVGTTPDDGTMPEGRASEGSKLVGKLLGNTEGGISETADERMLDRSEAIEDTTGGRAPDSDADGVGTGAVGPRRPLEGKIPGNSEMIDDKTDGRSKTPELAGPNSDVGIASELRAGAVGLGT